MWDEPEVCLENAEPSALQFGDDEFKCVCGNSAEYDGFNTCDAEGNSMEPTPLEWKDHYKCNRCDKIYQLPKEE
jgi:hypothetical protein